MTKKNKTKKKRGAALWQKAKEIIPGGNQLLSKRSEMFLPDQWPSYYKRAKGVELWDLDNRHYYDLSMMGIGTCVLGYANPGVSRAVKKALDAGNMSTLNCYEEVLLAERLIGLHPWAQMVRFARTGGEACAIAIRIARAAASRDKVLFCGYHGWNDWYLSSNLADSKSLDGQLFPGLEPLGVPRALKGTSFSFPYGNIEKFKQLIAEHQGEVGAVIMEIQRSQDIDLPFLREIRKLTQRFDIVLIFDEVTSGFRFRTGGMHILYAIYPDIVILGKALGNGHPIAAVIGRKNVMNAAQGSFISSTYWTERIGFAAAIEVIRQYESQKIPTIICQKGKSIKAELGKIFEDLHLKIEMGGLDPVPTMLIMEDQPLLIKTLFTQEMLKKGYLTSTLIYVSSFHTDPILKKYFKDAHQTFRQIALWKSEGTLEKKLEGPVCHSGFKRIV